jgi:hypothetical protein
MEFIETEGSYISGYQQYENVPVRIGICPHIPGNIYFRRSGDIKKPEPK